MYLKQLLRLFAIVGTIIITTTLCSYVALAQDYYVDVSRGKDGNSGDFSAPFQTIQHAANIVNAGDTVIINPGTYYENVVLEKTGTPDKPIIFKAAEYGRDKVIITGADKDVATHKKKWVLEDSELGMYSINLDYPIYRMTANDVQVVEYCSLKGLKTYIYNATDPTEDSPGSDGYAHGYEHGYFYDSTEKKLYVRLGNDGCLPSSNPNNRDITINFSSCPTSSSGSWKSGIKYSGIGQSGINGKESFLFGVTSETSANVVISGITFKMPAVTAVWARCHDLTVSNCWFIGCIEGVRGGCCATSDPSFVSKNIVIEYCYYTNYPIYTDAIKTLRKYANDPKARNMELDENGKLVTDENGKIPNVTVAKVLYFWHAKNGMTCNYEGGGLAVYMGQDWVIRYNHFDDLLDGFSSFGNFSYWTYTIINGKGSSRQTPSRNIKIYGNKFEKILDNAIEMEDNLRDVEISYNEFTSQVSPLSWQPLSGIPYANNINIHHNLIYNTPEEGWEMAYLRNHITEDGKIHRMSSPQYFGVFKLGASLSDFGNLSWMVAENFPMNDNGQPLDAVVPGNDGIRVWNNTIIYPNAAFEENVGLLGGGVDNKSNIKLNNNIIQVIVCAEDGTFKGGFKRGQAYTTARGIEFGNNMLVSGLDIAESKRVGDITVDAVPETTYKNEPIDDNNGIYKKSIEEVGFKDWKNGNFELTENSPARNNGAQLEYTEESTQDMGAIPYGSHWKITAGPFEEYDINADGVVDIRDIAEVGRNVDVEEFNVRADLDHNGVVDNKDIQIIMDIFNRNGGEVR